MNKHCVNWTRSHHGQRTPLDHWDEVMPNHLAAVQPGCMTSDASSVNGGLGRRRWLVLGVVGLAQLMVVLDLTIMNIALPSAQRALHFTTVDRQWVVTAYALAFG